MRFIPMTILSVFVLTLSFFFLQPKDEADKIITQCYSAKDHAACYEKNVPNLYPKKSISEIFDLVREIRQKDTRYQFCHLLAHKVGEEAVLEDPGHWLDLIPQNPAGNLC